MKHSLWILKDSLWLPKDSQWTPTDSLWNPEDSLRVPTDCLWRIPYAFLQHSSNKNWMFLLEGLVFLGQIRLLNRKFLFFEGCCRDSLCTLNRKILCFPRDSLSIRLSPHSCRMVFPDLNENFPRCRFVFVKAPILHSDIKGCLSFLKGLFKGLFQRVLILF